MFMTDVIGLTAIERERTNIAIKWTKTELSCQKLVLKITPHAIAQLKRENS